MSYPFEARSENDWMSKYFFSGGLMPAIDLLPRFDEHLKVEAKWEVAGTHYQRTSEAWLSRMDERAGSRVAYNSGRLRSQPGASLVGLLARLSSCRAPSSSVTPKAGNGWWRTQVLGGLGSRSPDSSAWVVLLVFPLLVIPDFSLSFTVFVGAIDLFSCRLGVTGGE